MPTTSTCSFEKKKNQSGNNIDVLPCAAFGLILANVFFLFFLLISSLTKILIQKYLPRVSASWARNHPGANHSQGVAINFQNERRFQV